MRFILKIFITLQCYNYVRNSVIIEKPEDSIPSFHIYWNVPSFQCRPHRILFTNVTKKYDIIQNENDEFRGEEIVILYDPGNFPAILEDVENRRLFYRNGGVPQEGNLTLHLELFEEIVNQLIPNKNFNGIGIIDFESWRPIFRQNWGTLLPYKNLSIEIEKKRHANWSKNAIEKEAQRKFELYGRDFMEETLYLVKELRPYAKWGYYAYPYCFNMLPNNMQQDCSSQVINENDRMKWLFTGSTAYYPSLYVSQTALTSEQMMDLIRGRITESQRIMKTLSKIQKKLKILPYIWLKYRDTKEYMSQEDLTNTFKTLKSLNVDGVIIWGSSSDVNSRKNCQHLYDYVDQVLGPIVTSH